MPRRSRSSKPMWPRPSTNCAPRPARRQKKPARATPSVPAYAADLARFWRVLRPDRPRAPAGQARELTLYLADLMDRGRADDTWPRRLSEIAVYHRAAGFSSSPIEHEVAQHPKTALIDVDLRQTIGAIDLTSRIGLRDRASLLLGFAGAFRCGELAALEVTLGPSPLLRTPSTAISRRSFRRHRGPPARSAERPL